MRAPRIGYLVLCQTMARKLSQTASFILGSVIFLYLLPVLPCSNLNLPKEGIDPSWVAVAHWAAIHNWQWGGDIAFNYGPLGFLWHRLFEPQLLFAELGLQLLLNIFLVGGVAILLSPLPPLVALLGCALVALGIILSRDGFFFLFPLLLAFGHFRHPRPVSSRNLIHLAVATGIISTVKVTYGLVGLAILCLVDGHRGIQRRWPIYTPTMVVVFFVVYLMAGQNPKYLLHFLSLSWQIVSGHSAAMALAGPWWELLTFLVISAVALLLLLYQLWRNGHSGFSPGWPHILAFLAVLGIFWLINFKQGFVRHDLHTLSAWGGFAATAGMLSATMPGRGHSKFFAGMLVIAFSAAMLGMWRWQMAGGPSITGLTRHILYDQPQQGWRDLWAWIRYPEHRIAKLTHERELALAQIREKNPMPPLNGTVDIIPSLQVVILAHGYNYQPRPIFQEYLAYTPKLIATNRAFLRSAQAPDYLFFSPGSIDDRYPSSAEGAIWPDLLRFYQSDRRVGDSLLLLTRRPKPLDEIVDINSTTTRLLRFGEGVRLADYPTVFARIRIEQTFWGRLADLLFKPAPIFLKVRLRDGSMKVHRLIPKMASEGFLLSPYVKSSEEFHRLASGELDDLKDQQVDEMWIETSGRGRFDYQERPELTLQVLQTHILRVNKP